MRVLSVISAFLVVLLASTPALSDICNKPASCPTNPAQVPTPYYALTFDSPPLASASWGYNSTDNDGCGHTGLALTGVGGGGSDGNSPSYIDLVNTTSPQSAGAAIPSIGVTTAGGSLNSSSKGWTFEATFKPLAQTAWAKVFCLGNGAAIGTVLLGYNSGNKQFDFTVNTADGKNNAITGTSGGNITPVPNPNVVLNSWYHVAVTVQNVDASGLAANWFAYVNGVLINGTGTSQFGVPDGSRPLSYIGRSCWNADALFQMELDAFRIYNQALNADQVTSLYAQQMGQCNITMTANPTITSAYPNALGSATTSVAPVWGLNFTSNPSSAVDAGVTPEYGWENYDQGDVTCGLNQQHQGLLVLQGGPNPTEAFADPSWVNLTATSGPNYIGNPALPLIGGPSFTSGSVSALTAGLSFEMTFKPALQETWAKVFDFGSPRSNGNCNGDLVFGWVGSSMVYMNFEVCDANGNGVSMGEWGPFLAGNWYHVVLSLQQLPNGNANWYGYINNKIASVSSNVPYPAAMVRQWSNLGRSNWNDETWAGWVDSFNLYNVALSPQQVSSLYTASMGANAITSCPFAPSNTSVIPASALYYDLSFTSNPAVAGQAYNWLAFDPSDSAATQQIHRGLVNLTGCVSGSCNGTYINMSAPTGPYSAGKVLGDIGGVGTGSISDSSVGWSFEVSFKSYGNLTWAKLIDIGDGNTGGNGNWEIFFGWHNNDPFYNLGVLFAGNQDYSSSAATALDNLSPATSNIAIGQWVHCVIVIQYDWLRSETNLGTLQYDGGMDFASYTVYTNGVLTGNSTGNLFPARVQRINANLGKSNYLDSYWQGLVDTFRVYSIALNANQAKSLYQASTVQPVVAGSSSSSAVPVVSSSVGSSASSAVSAGSSSSAASTAAPVVRSSSSTSAPVVVAPSSSAAPTSAAVVPSSSSVNVARSSSSTAAPATPSSTTTPVITPTSATTTPVVFQTSATSTYFPPTTVNGAVQSSYNLVAIAASVIAVLALAL